MYTAGRVNIETITLLNCRTGYYHHVKWKLVDSQTLNTSESPQISWLTWKLIWNLPNYLICMKTYLKSAKLFVLYENLFEFCQIIWLKWKLIWNLPNYLICMKLFEIWQIIWFTWKIIWNLSNYLLYIKSYLKSAKLFDLYENFIWSLQNYLTFVKTYLKSANVFKLTNISNDTS